MIRLLRKSDTTLVMTLMVPDPEHPHVLKIELTVSCITSLSIKNLAIDEYKLPNVDDILHTVNR